MEIVEKKISLSLCEEPIPYAYEESPVLTAEDYSKRIADMWAMPQSDDCDAIVVYGDREHYSNVYYYTGYDVRWEETLLILVRNQKPVLIVGNEGIGYTKGLVSDLDIKMYQTFSLMGQPNDERSKTLSAYFAESGIKKGTRIGLIGWKAYRDDLFADSELLTDIPYYIVRTLAGLAGIENLHNATDILADCEYGQKHNVSAKEIIQFDLAGTKISRGIYNCIKNAKPGMTGRELAQFVGFDGQPGNMYPDIKIGQDVFKGVCGTQPLEKLAYGMHFSAGYGLRGSLVHHLGIYARSSADYPKDFDKYLEDFLKPYFASIVHWYEMMQIGTECGDIYQMLADELGMEKFNISLNPGHLTHTDEWTNSPFFAGSKIKLSSGMAFQCDYTVKFQSPLVKAHIEDGLVLADENLREEIKKLSPTCWSRIEARQKFIRNILNINLPAEVLPLSDLSCICFPYMANTSIVLAKA